jgi:hypothetical protein
LRASALRLVSIRLTWDLMFAMSYFPRGFLVWYQNKLKL